MNQKHYYSKWKDIYDRGDFYHYLFPFIPFYRPRLLLLNLLNCRPFTLSANIVLICESHLRLRFCQQHSINFCNYLASFELSSYSPFTNLLAIRSIALYILDNLSLSKALELRVSLRSITILYNLLDYFNWKIRGLILISDKLTLLVFITFSLLMYELSCSSFILFNKSAIGFLSSLSFCMVLRISLYLVSMAELV